MASTYDNGDLVRCTAVFRDSEDALTNPTAVFFSVKTPSGETTTYTYGTDDEVVKDSAGTFYVDVDANEDGKWHYSFESTGTGQAASEGEFFVRSFLLNGGDSFSYTI